MTYLLDTNTCVEYLNRRDSNVRRRMATMAPTNVRLCSIVKAELYDGAYRSAHKEQNLALLNTVFSQFSSLPFDDLVAEVYGRIRAELVRKGNVIGPNDLMIAAVAIAHSLTLVTHNTREFSRVKGLAIDDWEAPAD